MRIVAEDKRLLSDLDLQQTGYALVHDRFLSIEFHMRLVDKEEKDFGQSLVTGLHRFELDGTGAMETTTVIATRTRRDGSPEFEPPGTTRHYQVEFEGETLTMTRDDGHRLEFERMSDDHKRRSDIFGRPVHDEDEDSGANGKEEGGAGGERKKD